MERDDGGVGPVVRELEDRLPRFAPQSTTPIDEENVHVRWTFTTPVSAGPKATARIADSFLTGVSQDIPIWENTSYNPRPVLTKQEKGILGHREWCRHFSSELA